MLTTITAIIGCVALFGLASLGLAVLVGIINDSIKFNVTFGKGKPCGSGTRSE
jgi:hypothetical protein